MFVKNWLLSEDTYRLHSVQYIFYNRQYRNTETVNMYRIMNECLGDVTYLWSLNNDNVSVCLNGRHPLFLAVS